MSKAFMRLDGFDDFLKAVKKAADGGVTEQIGLWLEAMGMEFLDLIQDEIIRTETTDKRWLLNSFQRGHSENVWSISNGGLTLEVGTNVDYAVKVRRPLWKHRGNKSGKIGRSVLKYL